MRRLLRVPIVLAVGLALVLGVAACGSGSLPVETAPSAGNDINPVARDRLEEGGTLRWPLAAFPPNFNFHEFDGTASATSAVIEALMPSLFVVDATGRPVPRREYLESAEVTATTPHQVVTYRLEPDATWSDGTPITAADLEVQWRALRGVDPRFRVAFTEGYDRITSVTAGRDDREALVTFAEPYGDWQALFTPLYPASTNSDPTVFNDGWKESPRVTAGPFAFAGIDPTAQTITLARNEAWWGQPAKLERIVYQVLDADARIDALANGEIDLADVGASVDALRRAEATPGVTVHAAPGSTFVHLTLNGTGEVLEDLAVREAVAAGVDRTTIARAVIGPLGGAPAPLGNHLLMANQQGYQDNSGSIGAYDPDHANALLDGGGWTRDGAGRVKDGEKLTLRYVIQAGAATDRQIAGLVQSMLAQVGIDVAIAAVPPGEFFPTYIRPGNFDLTAFSWSGSSFPISAAQPIYANPAPGPAGQLEIQRNYARIGSPQLDELFARAAAELDPARALEMANEIDRLIWQEVHSLPLYQRPEIVATNARLANYGAFGFASVIYEDIGFVKG